MYETALAFEPLTRDPWADGTARALPLRAWRVRAEASAGVARVELVQTFANPNDVPLAVTYRLPLPADAAVSGFRFAIDGAAFEGRVERREDARRAFEDAMIEGRTAAVLEQERTSFFTQDLANVPPGAEIEVTIAIDQPLAWRDTGHWEWRLPTTLGPRYLAGPQAPLDADRLEIGVVEGADLDVRLSLSLAVREAIAGAPRSPSHALERQSDGVVALAEPAALDRDVVIRWPVAAPDPGVRLARACPEVPPDGDPSAFAAIAIVPPAHHPRALPRHLVVLLDASSSMAGVPFAQAKRIVAALIATLGPRDHLELIAFASQAQRLASSPLRMAPADQARALTWLRERRASGSTRMLDAFRAAAQGGPFAQGMQKQIVLVTDGYVGNEARIVQAAGARRDRSARVHAVGVGSAPNRSLLQPVARAGSGVEVIVDPGEGVDEAIAILTARTDRPVIVDLEISGSALAPSAPTPPVPDLYAGSPAIAWARLRPEGGTLCLRGRTAEGPFLRTFEAPPTRPGEGPPHLATCWAREQVAAVEIAEARRGRSRATDVQLTKLGLDFQISTRLTSWIAETDATTVTPGGVHIDQPSARPAAMTALAFGGGCVLQRRRGRLRRPGCRRRRGAMMLPRAASGCRSRATPLARGAPRPTRRTPRTQRRNGATRSTGSFLLEILSWLLRVAVVLAVVGAVAALVAVAVALWLLAT